MAGKSAEQRDAEREQVREAIVREWGEPVRVLYLCTPTLRYRVRGRDGDGDLKPRDWTGWVVPVMWVISLPHMIMLGAGHMFEELLTWSFRDFVRGKEGSGAVRFADAYRGGSRWLVWSHSRTALLAVAEDGGREFVWTAVGPDRPEMRLPRRYRWPDGSRLRLSPLQWDRKQVPQELARTDMTTGRGVVPASS